jgi:site-specific recombinase XerD
MLGEGLSPATARKAVVALRQCLAAAMADNRLILNPADNVPLPAEQQKPPRFLSQAEVAKLAGQMPERYRATGARRCLWRPPMG